MSDDDLRRALARALAGHSPDSAAIRARLDAGRFGAGAGSGTDPRPGSAHQPRGRPGRTAPAAWALAAACAVTGFGLVTRPDVGGLLRGRTAAAVGPGQPSSTAAPSLPDSAVPRPDPSTVAPLPPAVATGPTTGPTTGPAGPAGPSEPSSSAPGTQGPGSRPPDATPDERCGHLDRAVRGRYALANNVWNAQAGSGTQCVRFLEPDPAGVRWTARWDWTGTPSLAKAYPLVARGWHWNLGLADPAFPVDLSLRRSMRTSWSYQLTEQRAGSVDVGYVVTLHAGAPTGPAQAPAAEVHVVLGSVRPVVAGRLLGTVTVPGVGLFEVAAEGSVWTLTRWDAQGRTSGSADLDLLAVTRALVPLGLDGRLQVSGVVAGADVRSGRATLVTSHYALEVT